MKTKVNLFIAGCALLGLLGCASPNTTTYNTENTLATAAQSATHAFNEYATLEETNGPIPSIEDTRSQLYSADKALAATLATVDAIRLEASTNSSATNTQALVILLQAASDQSSNIAATVKFIVSQTK